MPEARVWRSVLGTLLDEELSHDLESVVAPMLVIRVHAEQTEAGRLTAAIRGARLVTIPGDGHAPHWEDPTHVAQLVSDFVRSVR